MTSSALSNQAIDSHSWETVNEMAVPSFQEGGQASQGQVDEGSLNYQHGQPSMDMLDVVDLDLDLHALLDSSDPFPVLSSELEVP